MMVVAMRSQIRNTFYTQRQKNLLMDYMCEQMGGGILPFQHTSLFQGYFLGTLDASLKSLLNIFEAHSPKSSHIKHFILLLAG